MSHPRPACIGSARSETVALFPASSTIDAVEATGRREGLSSPALVAQKVRFAPRFTDFYEVVGDGAQGFPVPGAASTSASASSNEHARAAVERRLRPSGAMLPWSNLQPRSARRRVPRTPPPVPPRSDTASGRDQLARPRTPL